jgi:phosphatidate cytidylyltransferase
MNLGKAFENKARYISGAVMLIAVCFIFSIASFGQFLLTQGIVNANSFWLHPNLDSIVPIVFLMFLYIAYGLDMFNLSRKAVKINKSGNYAFVLAVLMLISGIISLIMLVDLTDLLPEGTTLNNLIFSLIITVGLADSGAYISGKSLAKPNSAKLYESLSPNKTWIGAIGGLTFASLGFVLLDVFFMTLPVVFAFFLAFIVSGFSIIGDLMQSLSKRIAEVDDSANLIPGHGGITDRIDGIVLGVIVGIMTLYSYSVML